MPFGAYHLNHPEGATFSQKLEICRDSLGFNYFWNHFTYQQIQEMADSGVVAIHQGDFTEAVYKFSNYHYAKIEAEQCNSGIRMYDCGGHFASDGDDSVWVSSGKELLFGPNGFNPYCFSYCDETPKLYIKMERKYPRGVARQDYGDVIVYNVSVRIKINSVGENVPVCSLKATLEPWNGAMVDTLRIRAITTHDIGTADTWAVMTGSFSMPESVYVKYNNSYGWFKINPDIGVAVLIETLGTREVKVDWIKIYDEKGFKLVESDDYRNEIRDYAESLAPLGSELWGFYLRDEPYYSGIPVMGAVMDTARAYGNPAWQGITCIHWDYNYRWWFDNNANADVFTPDIYPFTSDGYLLEPHYTGFDVTANSLNGHRNSRMLQNRLQYFGERCKLAYEAAHGSGAEFWIIPQCFTGGDSSSIFWRKPTMSELRCQTLMALTAGTRGIIFWKYGTSFCDDPSGFPIQGMYDCDDNRTDLWDAVAYEINPYIKAIDDTYMALTFRQGYYYSPVTGIDSSAVNPFVNTIYAASDTPNPDLGWFQIGEYTDGSDKYLMIVNRACSRGLENTVPAPPVTATIELDAASLGLGDFVGIIDLAKSVEYISYDSVLVSADTTFALSHNGVITFLADFEAGEGRLFKLAD